MEITPCFVAPNQGNHHDHKQFFKSFFIGNARVFNVETTIFERLEKRLHLPSFLVIKHGFGWLVKRYYYQKTSLSVFFNCLFSRHITQDIVDFDDFRTVSKFALFQVVEQPKNRFFTVLFKVKNLEIISYFNIIFDVVFVQKTEPFMAYKLPVPVGQQAVYFVPAEPFNKFVFALLPVLAMTMRCGPESEDIPELHGVKALIAVVPQKDVYQVGDTIALSIKAEKSKWNNWVYFEKAFFGFQMIFAMKPRIFHTPMIGRFCTIALLAASVLTTAMRCDSVLDLPPYYEPLPTPPELENVRAYASISPLKDVYKVGDTIVCTLRVVQKDWNNWLDFDYAEYHSFMLFHYGKNEPISEKSATPRKATRLPDGEKLLGAGDLLQDHRAFGLRVLRGGSSDISALSFPFAEFSRRTIFDR